MSLRGGDLLFLKSGVAESFDIPVGCNYTNRGLRPDSHDAPIGDARARGDSEVQVTIPDTRTMFEAFLIENLHQDLRRTRCCVSVLRLGGPLLSPRLRRVAAVLRRPR